MALEIGDFTAQSPRPLGLVIVGGLIISQILTLYFTPIVFTFLEGLRERVNKKRKKDNPNAPLGA
ncbi:MAG: efflux RND transporter permease subunit [Simkaniaceae bacterium]